MSDKWPDSAFDDLLQPTRTSCLYTCDLLLRDRPRPDAGARASGHAGASVLDASSWSNRRPTPR